MQGYPGEQGPKGSGGVPGERGDSGLPGEPGKRVTLMLYFSHHLQTLSLDLVHLAQITVTTTCCTVSKIYHYTL